MWTLAVIFAFVYALPELTLLIAYSTLEALGYSALFGIAMTLVVQRLDGPPRALALIIGGVTFGFPVPMMLSAGYPVDVSGIWVGRAIWFSIATVLLLIANTHLKRQQAQDRGARR
ncbi:MAG TPA: hypothetical protein VEA80_17250 [Vitreimonas sp.]|uniref:hypothetical protein n=1 Tax=Vitreimonas sp. TaxID=3069702 RepID=UPI002D4C1964|nr:hypothetical protein [Vitreimonas sp.]HYD89229.1 hypothetical protein [Vitreimonas sp.]